MGKSRSQIKNRFLSALALVAVAFVAFALIAPVPSFADEGASDSSNVDGSSTTAPVTITYTDGSTSTTWDGATSLDIIKNATLTVNSDFTATKGINIGYGATVTLNGNNHTITKGPDDTLFFVTGYKDASGSNLTIEKLTVKETNASQEYPVIYLDDSSTLTISDSSITSTNSIFSLDDNARLTVNSGSYSNKETIKNPLIAGSEDTGSNIEVIVNGGTLETKNQAVKIEHGSLVVNGGTIKNNPESNGAVALYSQKIFFNGGTLQGNGKGFGIALSTNVQLTGGKITGYYYGVCGETYSTLTVGNGFSIEANTSDFDLEIPAKITFLKSGDTYSDGQGNTKTASSWSQDNASVFLYPNSSVASNTKYYVTADGTSEELFNKLTSYQGLTRAYDSTNKAGYFYNHVHRWSVARTAAGSTNSIYVYCNVTSVPTCEYHNTKSLTFSINAEDATYTGTAYAGSTISNNTTSVGNFSVSDITYEGTGNTTYDASATAPTHVGTYKASVVFAGSITLYDTFEIKDNPDNPDPDPADKTNPNPTPDPNPDPDPKPSTPEAEKPKSEGNETTASPDVETTKELPQTGDASAFMLIAGAFAAISGTGLIALGRKPRK